MLLDAIINIGYKEINKNWYKANLFTKMFLLLYFIMYADILNMAVMCLGMLMLILFDTLIFVQLYKKTQKICITKEDFLARVNEKVTDETQNIFKMLGFNTLMLGMSVNMLYAGEEVEIPVLLICMGGAVTIYLETGKRNKRGTAN